MNRTPNRFSYLCLPMVMANQLGWEVLTPVSFRATWNGGTGNDAVVIEADTENRLLPVSHFGSGIVTFHLTYIFRTPQGHNLLVKGPANFAKDGIAPLEALVEADWLPNIFTMNYRFTRPGVTVRFEQGEPFCCLIPIQRHYVERFQPILRSIDADPGLRDAYKAWCQTRNADKSTRDQSSPKDRRKDYLHGMTASGASASEHQRELVSKVIRDELRPRREDQS